jgi:hypothetical protein
MVSGRRIVHNSSSSKYIVVRGEDRSSADSVTIIHKSGGSTVTIQDLERGFWSRNVFSIRSLIHILIVWCLGGEYNRRWRMWGRQCRVFLVRHRKSNDSLSLLPKRCRRSLQNIFLSRQKPQSLQILHQQAHLSNLSNMPNHVLLAGLNGWWNEHAAVLHSAISVIVLIGVVILKFEVPIPFLTDALAT